MFLKNEMKVTGRKKSQRKESTCKPGAPEMMKEASSAASLSYVRVLLYKDRIPNALLLLCAGMRPFLLPEELMGGPSPSILQWSR